MMMMKENKGVCSTWLISFTAFFWAWLSLMGGNRKQLVWQKKIQTAFFFLFFLTNLLHQMMDKSASDLNVDTAFTTCLTFSLPYFLFLSFSLSFNFHSCSYYLFSSNLILIFLQLNSDFFLIMFRLIHSMAFLKRLKQKSLDFNTSACKMNYPILSKRFITPCPLIFNIEMFAFPFFVKNIILFCTLIEQQKLWCSTMLKCSIYPPIDFNQVSSLFLFISTKLLFLKFVFNLSVYNNINCLHQNMHISHW